MAEPVNNAPRRYFVDAGGRRVLIGLTFEETFEFERLDSQALAGQKDGQTAREADIRWPVVGQQRWQELYTKHEGAWKAWMAQNRTTRPEGFSLY